MNKTISLDKLELDNIGKVINITSNSKNKRRFLDLGIMKGTIIKPIFRSPFSDPTAYEINNTIIAIRKEDANTIKIQKLSNNLI